MILVLGYTGYVGGAFMRFLQRQAVPVRGISRQEFDYTRRDELRRLLDELQPEFVINAAGFTGKPNVDASETQKLTCLEANTILPGRLAEELSEKKIPWGHVSSGCIYSGSHPGDRGFTEEDAPNFDFRHNNCSFYSGTKALAEELLKDAPSCYLWRLRIPFNEIDSHRNFLTKIMTYDKLLEVKNSISHLDEFVRACWLCWQKRLPFGIYNITNPGVVTNLEVAEMIQRAGFCPGKRWEVFRDEAEFMASAARTPRASCILDSSKITGMGVPLTEVHEAIERCLAQWVPAAR